MNATDAGERTAVCELNPLRGSASDPAEVTVPNEHESTEVVEIDQVELMAVGPTVIALLGVCMLTLFVVATPIPWFTRVRLPLMATNNVEQGLFWSKEKSTMTSITSYVAKLPCSELKERLRAVSAFAVISIASAALLTTAAIAVRLKRLASMKIVFILCVTTFVSSLICWAMGLRIFFQNGLFADSTTSLQCAATSFSAQKFEIGAGEALFITGWVISVIAAVVALIDPKVPAAVPEAALHKIGSMVFAALSFVAFVCAVIATPLDVLYLWIDASMVFRMSIWHVYIFQNGLMTTKLKFSKFADAFLCGDIAKYVSFAEAFAIIAIAFTLFACVSGLLCSAGKMGKAVPITCGLFAAVTALVCAAACATIYYRQFCNNFAGFGINTSFQEMGFQPASGFALMVTSFVVALVATIILIVVALVQHLKVGAPNGNLEPTAFVFLVGTFLSILFLVLGASQPLFSKNTSAVGYMRYTWWSVTRRDANGAVSDIDFACQDTWQRLYGGGTLVIISIFLSVVALLLGVVQLGDAAVRKAASLMGLTSSLTQMVAWSLAVAVFTGSYCDVEFYTDDYSVAVGLGLVIASWCVTLTVSTLNLLVEPECVAVQLEDA